MIPSKHEAYNAPDLDGVRAVLFSQLSWEAFVDLMYEHGLGLALVPVDDFNTVPSYIPAVGPIDWDQK